MGNKADYLGYEKVIKFILLVFTLSLFTLIKWKTCLRAVLRRIEITKGEVFLSFQVWILSSANSVKLKKFEDLRNRW